MIYSYVYAIYVIYRTNMRICTFIMCDAVHNNSRQVKATCITNFILLSKTISVEFLTINNTIYIDVKPLKLPSALGVCMFIPQYIDNSNNPGCLFRPWDRSRSGNMGAVAGGWQWNIDLHARREYELSMTKIEVFYPFLSGQVHQRS